MQPPDAVAVCRLDDIVPNTGVCALVAGRQVAVFRLGDDSVHAVGNYDPFAGANVISRGIVGDIRGELVVASPVYKQHFSLLSGRCIEDASVQIPVYAARVDDRSVLVEAKGETRSTCCYCGVGCGVVIESDSRGVSAVRGDAAHPANFGRLCTKGSTLHLSMEPAARVLHPELRTTRASPRRRASWDAALAYAAERFAACIARHGPDSVAFYISGQLLTEDYYVFNKLAKGLIGTNNVDSNSRLCMSSAVAGYKLSLGVDAPPCCYEDIDAADLILIAGANSAFAHPILFRRIEDARASRPGLKLIVIDPRATVTARAADLHLALSPGTDVALFNAMLHVIERDGLLDRRYVEAHTQGFADLAPLLASWTPERAAQVCGLPAEQIVAAARAFATARAALSLYCQGLNQSANGTYKNCALINLHLATGQIGRAGSGPFSLTGQPNAMGGREVGGMANLLSAHRDLADARDREAVARFWGIGSIPAKPGRTAVEMFQALGTGEIKAIWIAGTNPVDSMPDARAVRRALERAELVVVQEAFRGAQTCDYADVLLPAASWAEKEGTVTNSERRISRVRAAVAPPAEARPDWQVAVALAHRLGGSKLFPYTTAEDIFNEHRESTRGRDLDITGLSYGLLDRLGPQQWPFPAAASAGRKRLYEDGVFPTASGRARFVATEYAPPVELPDAGFPLCLTTGRLRDQWHTMTRTGLVARLFSHDPEPHLALHPEDLKEMDVADGDLVCVSSRRGSAVMKVRASAELRRGEAFAPIHWTGINALTLPALDPFSGQPELKHAAVRVTRFVAPWRSVMMCAAPRAELRGALAPWLKQFDYAVVSLAEGEASVFCVELAAAEVPPPETRAALDELFGLADERELLVHRDAARGVERRGRICAGALSALCVTGEIAGIDRLRQAMLSRTPVSSLEDPAMLLAGGGRAICACLGVGETQIRDAIAAGATLERLQEELKCGTSCGSCLPELRRLIAARDAKPQAALAA